jgi:gliding motility-associated-like protein
MTKTSTKVLFFVLPLIFLLSNRTFSQCGGTDTSITICNKETYNQGIGNPNGILNLFTVLTGETAGGTWVDLNSSGGLNASTGLLNTWAINQSGVFNYRYTVTGVAGCTDNTGVVTLTLGGYPGSDNSFAVACDNNPSVPLFSFLGSNPNPHFNGVWGGGPAGSIVGNFFNAVVAGVGTYTLTYTVPAIGTCPARVATVLLTVHPLPDSGAPVPLIFCETDDFSTFTNVDLFDYLTGEDGGGTWTENNATNQLTSSGDSFINIQDIYTNFGAGTYTFTYTVNPTHPICTPATTNVAVVIRPVVDLNGSTLNVAPNLCFNQIGATNLIGTITQGAQPIANGTYLITYVLTGANTGTQTVNVTFAGGTGSFTIPPSLLLNTGTSTVSISSVQDPSSPQNCTRTITNLTDIFDIFENPNVSNSQITIADICENEPAIVQISDITSPIIQLSNGSYTITYSITGPNGTLTNQSATVTITNGSGSFNISPAGGDGNYSVTITQITNTATGCSSTANLSDTFIVNPIPDATTISVSIPNICVGENVVVNISGANALPNGAYTVIYNLSGAITQSNLTANVNFTGGATSFTLPSGILQLGSSQLTIVNLFNTTSTCETTTFTNPNASFTINAIPDANDIDITIANICLNQSATVSIFDTNPGVNPELTNGSYAITYSLSGANTASNQNITTTLTSGSGSFTIPASLLTNTGVTNVTITIITNLTTGCDAVGVPISSSFTILPIPTLQNTSLSVSQPICFGSNGTVTINGATLANGNYNLVYNLSGANVLNNQAVSVVFNSGSASFVLNNSILNTVGSYTISIVNITDANTPNQCTNTVSNLTATFTVSENPNVTNTQIAATDPICLGFSNTVSLSDSGTLSNGTYTIIYNLSGANVSTNNSATITVLNGSSSFTVPSSLLTSAGNTTVTIVSIQNTSTNCITSPISISDTFLIQPLPDLTNANLVIAEPICLGSLANATLTAAALTNGNYVINYTLTGANTGTNSALVNVTSGSGTFIIPSNLLINAGNVTITINSVTNAATNCSSAVNISDSFTISTIPTINASQISSGAICIGNSGTVQITNAANLANGTYTFVYDLSGANVLPNQSVSVTINNGNGSFTVPASSLVNSGATLVSISSITNTTTLCNQLISNVTSTIQVNPLPSFGSASISILDTCLNENVIVSISNATLGNGNYTIVYQLSGANSLGNTSISVTFQNGSGTFSIPANLLPNTGNTSLTIVSLTNASTTCTNTTNLSDAFLVIPLPQATNLVASSSNICLTDDVIINFTGGTSLANGNYIINYNVTGANVFSGNTIVTFTAGASSFIIPGNLFANSGATTITIDDIILSTSQCGANTSTINPVTIQISSPLAPTLSQGGNLFCVQDNPTIADLAVNVTGNGTIIWYDAQTGGNILPSSTLLSNGATYYATVTDTNGCTSVTFLEVTVDLSACDDLFIPDGLSPNNDGKNDEFEIIDIEIVYPNYQLEFYNRYGNLVYKADINTPNFAGKSNQSTILGEELLPTGVYYYILYYNTADGKKPKQGRLYLSR